MSPSQMPGAAPSGVANWLAGDRLSLVLHIGDGPLAYDLSATGHEVTIIGDDVREIRDPEITYVRALGDRLPFRSSSFEVVIAPELREAPLALAEYARVLTAGGLLSTVTRHYDDSIPWMRRLRAITGDRPVHTPADTFTASGLFGLPEQKSFNSWEELDLPRLMQFAELTRDSSVPTERLAEIRDLWREFGADNGSLRLRHETRCQRARVDKSALPSDPEPPDVVLIDFD